LKILNVFNFDSHVTKVWDFCPVHQSICGLNYHVYSYLSTCRSMNDISVRAVCMYTLLFNPYLFKTLYLFVMPVFIVGHV